MKEVTEIRQLNLKKMEAHYGSQVALADILDSTTARINHLLTGHRNIGEKTARKFEAMLKKPSGWMDFLHDELSINNKEIIDLSKYNEDQRRLISVLLNSFDSQENKPENTQNKPLTPTTENVGGGAETCGQPTPDEQWQAEDRRINKIVDRRVKAEFDNIKDNNNYPSMIAKYKIK